MKRWNEGRLLLRDQPKVINNNNGIVVGVVESISPSPGNPCIYRVRRHKNNAVFVTNQSQKPLIKQLTRDNQELSQERSWIEVCKMHYRLSFWILYALRLRPELRNDRMLRKTEHILARRFRLTCERDYKKYPTKHGRSQPSSSDNSEKLRIPKRKSEVTSITKPIRQTQVRRRESANAGRQAAQNQLDFADLKTN